MGTVLAPTIEIRDDLSIQINKCMNYINEYINGERQIFPYNRKPCNIEGIKNSSFVNSEELIQARIICGCKKY